MSGLRCHASRDTASDNPMVMLHAVLHETPKRGVLWPKLTHSAATRCEPESPVSFNVL